MITPALAHAQNVSVSGVVTERTSGEAVIGATVILHKDSAYAGQKNVRGAYSNKFGFYSIPNVEPGNYFLTVRSVGYRVTTTPVTVPAANEGLRMNVQLEAQDVLGEEIIVQGQRNDIPTTSVGRIDLETSTLQRLPAIGGETDIFRALQLLPGVKAVSEISSGLYVRGGSPDQNLTLLDGVIVYNPSHLFGFLSTFNSDAIRDIKLIKGAFPAEYGGRLSSVLDLTMREGTKEKISGKAAVSLINSRLTLEGPITEDATFMISGRRMYLDLILLAAPESDEIPRYYFYDLNGKVNYKISEDDRIYFSAYLGSDVLTSPPSEDDVFQTDWGNITANFRWAHIVSPTLFTNFSAILTDYRFSTLIEEKLTSGQTGDDNFKSVSGIRDYMLRGEAQYYPDADHQVKAGLELTQHRFRADVSAELSDFGKIDKDPNIITSLDASLYLQDEWQISDVLAANIGGRLYYFEGGNQIRVEPRVSIAWEAFQGITLKSAFSTGNQFLHLITRNDLPLPTDVWFPSTETLPPSEAMQIVVGGETRLFDDEYLLTVEGYYKSMKNLLEYQDTVSFSLDIPLESSFTSGKGEAYGVEVFLNKRVGDFTGWIGYTLAWTKRTFPELNNGKTFFPRYDRRHDASVVLTYKLGEKWELGATWVYGTGQAYTMPSGQYQLLSPGTLQPGYTPYYNNNFGLDYESRNDYTEQNGYRLPPFHKMDLNFTHSYSWFSLPWQVSINIYNVYNNRNVFYQYVDKTYDYDPATGDYVLQQKLKRVTLFPIIPTFGLSVTF